MLKINNGAANILVQGNIFYNQSGSDVHIDINSVSDIERYYLLSYLPLLRR